MLQDDIDNYLKQIAQSDSLTALEDLRISLLGKSGVISLEMRKMGALDEEGKKAFGKLINDVKSDITDAIDKKYEELKTKHIEQKLKSEKLDLSLPARQIKSGYPSNHPGYTGIIRDICKTWI